jgi:hypothetical protein
MITILYGYYGYHSNSDASVTPSSQICMSAILLIPIVGD